MPIHDSLIQRDLQHIWHPCSYMNDFKNTPPLIIEKAQGSYLHTDKGLIIDAISSWWCKSLGHGHPAIISAITDQLTRFEHVISANTTNPQSVALAEKLAKISHKQHVYFASDGACAVEIALKLALQATQIKGETHRQDIIALKNSYHGETIATLSVSNLGLYSAPFSAFGLNCHFLDPIPYVAQQTDPAFKNCEIAWEAILPQLESLKDTSCAILVEPLVQGAGGMRIYSADFLQKLAYFAKQNNLYLIADEIMTGLGRTGKWLACDYAGVEPDLICLSKGLTSGSIPLSCVLIDHAIYDLFNHSHGHGAAFLHSHTYSGHSLAMSAALATLQTLENEGCIDYANHLGAHMRNCFSELATQTQKITNIRSLGAIVAGDLVPSEHARIGHRIANKAMHHGALLRPINKTIYWLPPLNTDFQTIDKLTEITYKAIQDAYVL